MYDYQLSLDQARRQRRRRRIMLVGLIVLLVLLANLLVLASMDSPELSIQSMSLDHIDISNNRLYVSLYLAVFNVNSMDSYLSGVEGKVISGGVVLDKFSFDDSVQIAPHVNMTVQYSIAVDDAPLPLSDPVLKVEGKARVRSWIQGITYHYAHSIPLTHSPDLDNQPPVAEINGPLFARRGHPAAFDGTDSYDPDGKVVGWTWDFGDGQRAEGARVEHTFLSQGMYTIRLTVVDQMGVRSGTTIELRVLPL